MFIGTSTLPPMLSIAFNSIIVILFYCAQGAQICLHGSLLIHFIFLTHGEEQDPRGASDKEGERQKWGAGKTEVAKSPAGRIPRVEGERGLRC